MTMAIKKEEEEDDKQDTKNELDALDALEKEASEFNKVYPGIAFVTSSSNSLTGC